MLISNFILRKLYPSAVLNFPGEGKSLYLTFDDGPIEGVTDWILEELEKYNAKATFFCLGENIKKNPSLYDQILKRGHASGNHSYDHPDGWKVNNKVYFESIRKCSELVTSSLFRPPYGRISFSQYHELKKKYNIVLWDVLSKDYSQRISPEKCLNIVLNKAENGSIIVFHDSLMAFKNLKFVLPEVLKHYSEKGFVFEKIPDRLSLIKV